MGPAAHMEEACTHIEELDKVYAHVVKNGYDGVPAAPVGLEPLFDVLPQNPVLKCQGEPDEEACRKAPSEWTKCRTIPDGEEFKKAVSEMARLGKPLLEKWLTWHEKYLRVLWESLGWGAPDMYDYWLQTNVPVEDDDANPTATGSRGTASASSVTPNRGKGGSRRAGVGRGCRARG